MASTNTPAGTKVTLITDKSRAYPTKVSTLSNFKPYRYYCPTAKRQLLITDFLYPRSPLYKCIQLIPENEVTFRANSPRIYIRVFSHGGMEMFHDADEELKKVYEQDKDEIRKLCNNGEPWTCIYQIAMTRYEIERMEAACTKRLMNTVFDNNAVYTEYLRQKTSIINGDASPDEVTAAVRMMREVEIAIELMKGNLEEYQNRCASLEASNRRLWDSTRKEIMEAQNKKNAEIRELANSLNDVTNNLIKAREELEQVKKENTLLKANCYNELLDKMLKGA